MLLSQFFHFMHDNLTFFPQKYKFKTRLSLSRGRLLKISPKSASTARSSESQIFPHSIILVLVEKHWRERNCLAKKNTKATLEIFTFSYPTNP